MRAKKTIIDYKAVSEIDWARLAAYIDGERTILIDKVKAANGGRPCHFVALRVANTNIDLMQWVKSTFGGFVYVSNPTTKKTHHKTCFNWSVRSVQANEVLLGCFPYLIVKTKQAKFAILLRMLFGKPGKRTDDENYKAREVLYTGRKKFRTLEPALSGKVEERRYVQ